MKTFGIIVAISIVLGACTKAPQESRTAFNCDANPQACNGGLEAPKTDTPSAFANFSATIPKDNKPGEPILISWPPVEGAKNYSIAIGLDKECKQSVAEVNDLKEPRQQITITNDGTFYVCVSATMSSGEVVKSNNNGTELKVGTGDSSQPSSPENRVPVISHNVAATENLGTITGSGATAADPFTFNVDQNSTNGVFAFTVTDADGDDTTSVTAAPSWITVDQTNKKFTFAPLQANVGNVQFNVAASDGKGNSNLLHFSITVVDVNDTPTDIALANSSVAENAGADAVVGAFSSTDLDTGDTHTYTLVAGSGDTDNASFNISGANLRLTASADFESQNSYSVRIRSTDSGSGSLYFEKSFSISVTDANDNPTDISLSASTIAENNSANATVGTLSSTDVDSGDTHTYSLVAGAGDTDNGSFDISGSSLRLTPAADFESKNSYAIRIRSTDSNSGTFDKQFTISITDANDAPTDISLSSSSIAENNVANATVGSLSATDQDSGDGHTFTLVAGAGDTDNGSFTISGSNLRITPVANYEAKSLYSVRIRATDDGTGTLAFEKVMSVTITDANEAPTDLAIDSTTVNENAGANAAVGNLSTTDVDSGDTFVYTLVAGSGDADNASFNISGASLRLTASANHEVKETYNVRVQTQDQGGTGLTYSEALVITINDVNEAPTAINFSSQAIDENAGANASVGTMSSTDVDDGDTFVYSLVAGSGDTDNGNFNISGNSLRLTASANHESTATMSIRVQTQDVGGTGLTYVNSYTITINDVNENPTDISLSSNNIDENNNINDVVGTLSGSDPDASSTLTYALASGVGDTDNASFNVSVTSLRASAAFDYEIKNSYSIRLRVTDNGAPGLTYDEVFTININDIDPEDTTPPPALTSFTGATGDIVNKIKITLDFPADVSDYDNIKIYRNTTGSASTGVAAPACGSGTLVTTITNFANDPLVVSETVVTSNNYYSYRACIYDAAGNDTDTDTAIDVLAKQAPSDLVYYNAADADGNGTPSSGDIGSATTSPWGDVSGSNDGTMSGFNFNTTNSGWDGAGTAADPYRLKFDGTDDKVVSPSLAGDAIMFWFLTHTTDSSKRVVFEANSNTKAYIQNGVFRVKYNDSLDFGKNYYSIAISENTWNHYVMSNDGSTTRHYLNGIEFASSSASNKGSTTFTIGDGSVWDDSFFDGEIAQFRIYDDNLTADDVAAVYLDSRPTFYSAPANITLSRIVGDIGDTAGSTSITAWGWNFSGLTGATIDGNAGTSVSILNSNGRMSFSSPAGSIGYDDLVISDASNSSTAIKAFRYSKVPTDNMLLYVDAANIDSLGANGDGESHTLWTSLSNGHQIFLHNFAQPTNGSSGWDGNSTTADPDRLDFDGTNDVAWLGRMNPQSFAIWFHTDVTDSSKRVLMETGNTKVYFQNGLLRFKYNDSTDFGKNFHSVGVETNTWYNLAVSNNGSTSTWYLNGVEVSSDSDSSMSGSNVAIRIGHGSVWDDSYFDGGIAEILMYSDALTEAEIVSIFLEGRTRFESAPANLSVSRIVNGLGAPTTDSSTINAMGWNFTDVTDVQVGGTSGSSLVVNDNSGKLTLQKPSGTQGFANIYVDDSSNPVTLTSAFYYTNSARDNLVHLYDAGNIDSLGTRGSGNFNKTWQSIAGGNQAAMLNFATSSDPNSGWDGAGTTGNPYRIKLDGTDDEIRIARAATARTLSIWFNADTIDSSKRMLLNDNNNVTRAYVQSGNLQVKYNNSGQYSTAVSAGTWYHLVIACDGTTVRFYLNGSEFDNEAQGAHTTAYSWRVGMGGTWDDAYFDGSVAEIRIYSDHLTAAEVTTLYNETSSRFP